MTSARDVLDLSRAILGGRDGYVVVLKIYMESGIHDGSPALSVGAYVALPSVWGNWTKAWNRQKRPIRVFHSNDCANLRGEFEGWDEAERDSFVANLLPTIPDHKLTGFVAGIQMDDFREVCAAYPRMGEALGEPYVACFQWVVMSVLEWLDTIPHYKRSAFFHETNSYKGDALNCFEYLKEHFDKGRRKMSLTFGDKDGYVPLQAADTLAYEGNKRFRKISAPLRRAWKATNPTGQRRQATHFDKESLLRLAEEKYAD